MFLFLIGGDLVGISAISPLNCDMILWNDCEWLIDDRTAIVGNTGGGGVVIMDDAG